MEAPFLSLLTFKTITNSIWTLSWISIVVLTIKHNKIYFPPLANSFALGWEVASLTQFNVLPDTFLFKLNYVCWPILSLIAGIYYLRLTRDLKNKVRFIVYCFSSFLLNIYIMKVFDNDGTFLFSGTLLTFIISLSFHFYYRDKHQPMMIGIPRSTTALLQSIVVIPMIEFIIILIPIHLLRIGIILIEGNYLYKTFKIKSKLT